MKHQEMSTDIDIVKKYMLIGDEEDYGWYIIQNVCSRDDDRWSIFCMTSAINIAA